MLLLSRSGIIKRAFRLVIRQDLPLSIAIHNGHQWRTGKMMSILQVRSYHYLTTNRLYFAVMFQPTYQRFINLPS